MVSLVAENNDNKLSHSEKDEKGKVTLNPMRSGNEYRDTTRVSK